MAYEKQIWVQYNPNLTYNDNYNNGAIVTEDKLNHMEKGIEEASLGGGGVNTTALTKAEYYEDDPNNLITPGSYIVTPGSYTNVPDGNKNKYFVNVSSVTAFSANSQQKPDLQNLAVSVKSDKSLSITASIPQNSGFYTGTVIQVWHEIDLSFNTISTWLRTGSIVTAGTVTWSAYKRIPQSLSDFGIDISNYMLLKPVSIGTSSIDDIKSSGRYLFLNYTNGPASMEPGNASGVITNGILYVDSYSDSSTLKIEQRVYDLDGKNILLRNWQGETGTGASWSAWQRYLLLSEADAKYITQVSKAYSGDLDDLGTGGSYIIAPGLTNAPNATDYFFVNVQSQGTTANYGVNQTATDIATGEVYSRTKATGHSWTPWSHMVTTNAMQAALASNTQLVKDEATAQSDSTNNPTVSYVVPEAS